MDLIVRWIVMAAALAVTGWIVPGIQLGGVGATFLAAVVIGLINALVKPVLVLLTLPLTVVTLGVFLLILNALLFWLAAALVPGFEVSGFVAAFFGAIVLAIVGWALAQLV